MMYFLTFCFLFILGAVIGYLMEFVFRRIVHHQWINPGFLVGPYLPLYGFGVSFLYIVARLFDYVDVSFLNGQLWVKDVLIVVIMAVSMTLIEYITGLIFIKGMNIKLWDYSRRWGNIQGIICPLFSLAWAAIAAVYFFCIDTYLVDAAAWLSAHLEFSFIVGMVGGIMLIDVCYSFQLSAKIKRFARENRMIVKWEELKESIKAHAIEAKEKKHFLLSFHSSRTLKESLQLYKEKLVSAHEQKKHGKD